MTSTSDYPLSVLRTENHLHGFAVWQILEPYGSESSVFNQPQAKDYDSDAPQAISVRWDDERGDIPPDWYQYTAMVLLDSELSFNEQVARLTVISDCSLVKGTYYLTEATYTMPLGRLMQLLPRLQQYASQILPCLECEVEEYSIEQAG